MRNPAINYKADYIGRKGACAKCSYGSKNCWHWERVDGRTFTMAILESGYVMLREIGGKVHECGCAVPVDLFWKVFSEVRS